MISFSWMILKYSENVKIMISGYIMEHSNVLIMDYRHIIRPVKKMGPYLFS